MKKEKVIAGVLKEFDNDIKKEGINPLYDISQTCGNDVIPMLKELFEAVANHCYEEGFKEGGKNDKSKKI